MRNPPPLGRPSDRRVRGARRFYAHHKRSLLLAAALVLAVTAAIRVIAVHGPFTQKSDLAGPSVKVASAEAPSSAAASWRCDEQNRAGVRRYGPDRLDQPGALRTSAATPGPTPPELSAAMPSGVASGLREAVLSGSPAAQYDLAQQLFEGRALPQDQAKAAFWFARAASAGYAPAEFRLGALYQKGVGVERDPVAAKRWYLAAAEAGNARAAHNLGVMNAEPVGEKADYGEAAKWFRRAAEMGVRDSQYNLAVLYARGLGVDQDLRQSWLWFSLAAAQGRRRSGEKARRGRRENGSRRAGGRGPTPVEGEGRRARPRGQRPWRFVRGRRRTRPRPSGQSQPTTSSDEGAHSGL